MKSDFQKKLERGRKGICKRRNRAVFLTAVFLLTVLSAMAVSVWTPPVTAYAAAPSTTVTKKTLYTGYENYQIKFKNLSSSAVVTYKSSNTKVAKVTEKGLIKPVAKGSATITVTIKQSGKTYKQSIAVTVKNPSISIPNKKTTLVQSSDYLLAGKAYGIKNAKLTYSSSETMIASVDKNTGMVHAKAAGTTKITMKDSTSGKSVSFTLKVVEQNEENADQVYVSTTALAGGYSYSAPKKTASLTEEELEKVKYLTDIQERITKEQSITIKEMSDYYSNKSTEVKK